MKTRKRIITIFALILALITLAALYEILAPRAVDASNVEIKIDNFTFAPVKLVVRKGTRVTWTNRDDVPHTVVENNKVFRSHVLDTGENFSFTPTQPGTYRYYCSIHPKMTAEIVVR
jgi:plastocyanin